jgi:hypothetical protein
MARAKLGMQSYLFRLPPDLYEKVLRYAEAKGLTRQEAMIDAMELWLNVSESQVILDESTKK